MVLLSRKMKVEGVNLLLGLPVRVSVAGQLLMLTFETYLIFIS